MIFRQIVTLSLLLAIVLGSVAFAQEVVMPDLNLQRAVRTALKLHPQDSITSDNLQHLERLKAENLGIINITGLEHATGLTILNLKGNQISDLTPLANLTKLRNLSLGGNQISGIGPLANLINLRELHLTNNSVMDVSPLSHLPVLRKLHLSMNLIEDVSPLAHLDALFELDIRINPALDYSTLFAIPYVSYDECCDVEALPVRDRIANRSYPSIAMPWGGGEWSVKALNRPELTREEQVALHDMWWFGGAFGIRLKDVGTGWKMVGNISEGRAARDHYLSINPNMIFLKAVRMRSSSLHGLPADSPYWLRDEHGHIVIDEVDKGHLDFTKPAVQNRILAQVKAIDRCGLFDGIFIDHWNDGDQELQGYRTVQEEQRARETIIQLIRLHTRPDFLVFVNAGARTLPRTGPLVNGTFMEVVRPGAIPLENIHNELKQMAATLSWSEVHMREPRINMLEGWGNIYESPNSSANRRGMRVFTTISLTHSDGYTLFTNGDEHRHAWYDFWDADLGRPVGGKAQLYQETEGLYIREFTNGWAVYNHSGASQMIALPEEVQGVASGLAGTEHALPNLDGEMYLRVTPPNPVDVNGDGVVNILDLTLVVQGLGTDSAKADVNGDGVVNVFDLVIVANAF